MKNYYPIKKSWFNSYDSYCENAFLEKSNSKNNFFLDGEENKLNSLLLPKDLVSIIVSYLTMRKIVTFDEKSETVIVTPRTNSKIVIVEDFQPAH
jgi:hypothetical protein